MRKILLKKESENYKYYKVNLHCHTVISDGCKTPEQIKADYKARGYGAVAFTDHDIFLTHNDLTDENFVALNGYEMEVNEPGKTDFKDVRTCHMCFVAKDPSITKTACYCSCYFFANAPKYAELTDFDPEIPPFYREYTPEKINEMFEIGKNSGFFCTYNHPEWSREGYNEYSQYNGMNAMEICNFSCTTGGEDRDNGAQYNELLRLGNRIFCVAADDNHNVHPDDNPMCDSYGGYVKVGAEALNYESIINGLTNGAFYSVASSSFEEGPEFKEISVEDNTLTVVTSDVKGIYYISDSRSNQGVQAGASGHINSADFYVRSDEKWFRLVIEDSHGHRAFTNAFFIND